MEVAAIGKSERIYTHFPAHQHGYWEILLNTKGSGTMQIGDSSYEFVPGDIFIIPPFTPHEKTSPDGFTDMAMFLKDFREIGGHRLLQLHDDPDETVLDLFRMGLRFKDSDLLMNNAMANALGDLLYQVLASLYKGQSLKSDHIERVLRVMNKNISNPDFDLAGVIEAEGYSSGYFRRVFKEACDMPPVEYFNHLRINRAKTLFQQYGSSRSVQDVATACGFKDPLYFSRLFKKHTGVSPREYMHTVFDIDMDQIIME